LLVQTIQTPEQQKWAAKLQGFSFSIHYKPGKTNLEADALSRKYSDATESLLLTVSSAIPNLLGDRHTYYSKDTQGKLLVSKILQNDQLAPQYSFKEGLLFF
jgi:hypothetical protein